MIIERLKGYSFENLKLLTPENYVYSPDAIILKLRLKKQIDCDCTLFELPGTLSIKGRRISKNTELTPYERGECFLEYADDNGITPVIEISLFFEDAEHPQWSEMKLGLPLTLYDIVKDDLYVVCDGIYFSLVYGGIVVNYNLPYGKIKAPTGSFSKNDKYLDFIHFSTSLNIINNT